ncbi:MAG: hypothetical protein KatS3mg109_1703 [Pirellulaceae bacterium]|nr:MAG: hypothetical protein KatS3mg109_1703 [Pirellulaceae bacterium]GIW96273.1 MAG: hypothetical protein KatS3mg110_4314 [Pirellulaceae bacterium]
MARLFPKLAAVLAIFGLLCTSPDLSAQTEKTLRLHLNQGDVLHIQVRQDMDIAVEILPDQPATEMKMIQEFRFRQEVQSVEADGTATVRHTIERVILEAKGAQEFSFKVDTEAEGEATGIAALVLPLLKTLKGMTFTTKTSPRGEIQQIEFSDELAKAINESEASPALKEVFSKDNLRNLVRQVSAVFPEQPVKKGDKWTYETEHSDAISGRNQFLVECTYNGEKTLNEIPCDVILVKTTIKPADGVARVKFQKHESHGELYFDAKSGLPVGGNLQHETVMRVNDMFNQTIRGKTTITVEREKNDG